MSAALTINMPAARTGFTGRGPPGCSRGMVARAFRGPSAEQRSARRLRPARQPRPHLGGGVLGVALGAGEEAAFLAGEGALAPAVEEVGHVGVLLGLGDVELAPAVVGKGFAE